MENSVLSVDSLGESELDLLRDKLKQKDHIIAEKSEIISSLRQQVNDLNNDLEEMENSQQLLNQKVDRLTKDVREKDEELDAVSHALREVETAHENLSKRMEARTEQLQKFVEDLVKAKKELETVTNNNEELKHKNEQLTIELQLANSKRRSSQEQEQQVQQESSLNQEKRQMIQKQPNYKQPIATQERKPTYSRIERHDMHRKTSEDDENRHELASALHFPMADEIGEIMDTSSMLPPRSFGEINQTQPAYTPATIKRELIVPEQRIGHPRSWGSENIPEGFGGQARPNVFNQRQPSNIGPDTSSHCPNHRNKRSQAFENQVLDPIAEHKMRIARAEELARRNMQTKPLHQTSYALELDTFDTTEITEQEIKRGNIPKLASRPPQRPPPQPPVQKHRSLDSPPRQQSRHRHALSNCTNTPPVTRRAYPKAEAFVVSLES